MSADESRDGNESNDVTLSEEEKWRKYYVDHPKFDMKRKGLLKKLVKISAVERNLALHGKQTSEKMFERLKNDAVEAGKECDFKSAEKLDVFCKMHTPIFLYRHCDKTFRNSSRVYRKFCQFLRMELENGEKVNEDTIHKIVDAFVATLPERERESQTCFVKNEVFEDLKTLRSISVEMPRGFVFATQTRELSLSSTHHEMDTLHYPIMADTYDVTEETVVDKSRRLLLKAVAGVQHHKNLVECRVIGGHYRGCIVNVPVEQLSNEKQNVEEGGVPGGKFVYVECWPRSAHARLEAFAITERHDESMWTKAEPLEMTNSAVEVFDKKEIPLFHFQ